MVNSSPGSIRRPRGRHDEDFKFWAKCPVCCRTGLGVVMGDYFSCAYTSRQWDQGPRCVNCATPMALLYEVKYDEDI